MDLKRIVSNDTLKVEFLHLLNYCFGIKVEEFQYELDNLILKENAEVLGAVEGERLLSALIIHDFKIFWQGLNVSMGGIGCVTSYPEYRDGGIVTKLIKQSLREMYAKGQLFSMLNPFDYHFYRKYGWEIGEERKSLTVDIEELKGYRTSKYTYQPLVKENLQDIIDIYCHRYQPYNGACCRSPRRWEHHFDQSQKQGIKGYGCYDHEGNMQGYLIFKIKDQKLTVCEMAYRSIGALKALLGFIFVHRAQVNKAVFDLPKDCPLMLMLKNPRQETKLVPGMMVRVIDVRKVLELYPYQCNEEMEFNILIEDDFAPWNTGLFNVEMQKNQLEVDRIEDYNEEMWDLKCSIQVFSQLVFGYLSLQQCIDLELIEYKSKERVEELKHFMPKGETFVTEFF